jgi:hypothetical protein
VRRPRRSAFIDLFDEVFVLQVDLATLHRRLDQRPDEEWGGGRPTERARIVRWHRTGEDVPTDAVAIDATAPIEQVVDEILRRCGRDAEGMVRPWCGRRSQGRLSAEPDGRATSGGSVCGDDGGRRAACGGLQEDGLERPERLPLHPRDHA